MVQKYSLDNFLDTETYNGGLITDLFSFKFDNFFDFVKDRLARIRILDKATEGQPDLVSYLEYGNHQYWWIICLANKISDPINGFSAGRKIAIPQLADIESYYQTIGKATKNRKVVSVTLS